VFLKLTPDFIVAKFEVVMRSPSRGWCRGGQFSSVQRWDAQTYRRLATLDAVTKMVSSVAFSPDGSTLATAGWDGKLRLWDVHRRRLTATLAGHTDSAQSVAFTPDGNTLTTSSDDGTVRLWDTDAFNDLATLTDNACTVAGRSLTEQEWRRYVRDGVAYHRICPEPRPNP
jgi:WD40 repeat protein